MFSRFFSFICTSLISHHPRQTSRGAPSRSRSALIYLPSALLLCGLFTTSIISTTVSAIGCPDGYVESNVIGNDTTTDDDGNTITYTDAQGNAIRCAQVGDTGDGIMNILSIVLNILTSGIGILATFGITISGIQYLTARDNDAQVAKAKLRILEIVIGLIVYALLWTLLQFIIPGGIWGTEGI